MDGVHDMGGMDGFGKVEAEQNEPPFHAPWEGRVLAMQRAMGYAGAWHIDHSRFAQEKLPPLDYLGSSYYQRWALAMESNVTERGYATPEELKAGHALTPGKNLPRKLTPDVVGAGLTRARSSASSRARSASSRATGCAPRTSIRRRTRGCRATRAASSAWSRCATAATCIRTRSRPTRATIRNGSTRWCSTSQELWGPDADPTLKISIDAFEPYLDPA